MAPRRYRLLVGQHAVEEPIPGKFYPDGRPVLGMKVYREGSIVTTETDLLKRCGAHEEIPPDSGNFVFNKRFPQKFELVKEDNYVPPAEGPITEEELKRRHLSGEALAALNEARAKVDEAAKQGFNTTYSDRDRYPAGTAPILPGSLQPGAVPSLGSGDPTAIGQAAMWEKMTENELRREAEDLELNVEGIKGRDAFLKLLKGSTVVKPQQQQPSKPPANGGKR